MTAESVSSKRPALKYIGFILPQDIFGPYFIIAFKLFHFVSSFGVKLATLCLRRRSNANYLFREWLPPPLKFSSIFYGYHAWATLLFPRIRPP